MRNDKNLNNPQTDALSTAQKAEEKFGEEGVKCFEQMFQTNNFDFSLVPDKSPGTVVHYTAFIGDLDKMKQLQALGANLLDKNWNGRTAIHYSAQSGNLEMVQWLAEQGLDVNAKDDSGNTLMFEAADSENLALAQWLAEQGLDVNAKNEWKETPLFYAASGDNLSLTQ